MTSSSAEWLNLVYEDAGPKGWNAGETLTAREIGELNPVRLLSIPGRKGEHELFLQSDTGRMSHAAWKRFVSSIDRYGVRQAITIHIDRDGAFGFTRAIIEFGRP